MPRARVRAVGCVRVAVALALVAGARIARERTCHPRSTAMKFSWMWRGVAAALLAAWVVGLAFAAVRLGAWQSELVHTLLQMRADRAMRVRMAARHEPIPREWYRSKALALLAAADRLQDDSRWTLVLPGSWRGVDTLRDRLAQRIEREFADIAVETVRRELDFRA